MEFGLEEMEEVFQERLELASDRIGNLILEGEASLEPWLEAFVLTLAKGIDKVLSQIEEKDGADARERAIKQPLSMDKEEAPGEDPLLPYLDTASYMLSWIPSYVKEGRSQECLIHMELFLELLGVLKDGTADGLSHKRMAHNIQQTLYYFLSDYGELLLEDYLGYWFASACFYELPGFYEWAGGEGRVLHQAHRYDLAYFMNHNMKERMLFQCSFWQGKCIQWLEWKEDSLERFHPKQRKQLAGFREGLQGMEQEA